MKYVKDHTVRTGPQACLILQSKDKKAEPARNWNLTGANGPIMETEYKHGPTQAQARPAKGVYPAKVLAWAASRIGVLGAIESREPYQIV